MRVWIQISYKFWLIRMNLESKRSGTESQIEHKTVLVFLMNHHTDLWSTSTNEILILRRFCSRRLIFNRKPKLSEELPRENLNDVGSKIGKKLHNTDHEVSVRILTSYIMIQRCLEDQVQRGDHKMHQDLSFLLALIVRESNGSK
jgi:hypothetical protein